jgi:hypothetical protein
MRKYKKLLKERGYGLKSKKPSAEKDSFLDVPTFGLWNSLAEINLSVHRHIFSIVYLTRFVKSCSNKIYKNSCLLNSCFYMCLGF